MKQKHFILTFALSLILGISQFAYAGGPGFDKDDAEPTLFCVTIDGVDYEVPVYELDDPNGICIELDCGEFISPHFSIQYPAPCPVNPKHAGGLAESLAQQFANDYCNQGYVCCPGISPLVSGGCVVQCRMENLSWTCNTNILVVDFNIRSTCRSLIRN